jgi:glycerophosphoryl diester phosphodiesterase
VIVSAHDGYPRWLGSGADYIEVDVRRTPDGVFVLSHDEPGPGAKLATLDEALTEAAGRIGVQLDLKESGYELELVERVRTDNIVITTPDRAAIAPQAAPS